MIRLFAAIAIQGEAAEQLAALQTGVSGARWRPIEGLHVTLRFFGEVAEDRADDLDLELAQVRGGPFDLTIEGAGAFGEGLEIDSIWAGVRANPALEQLARRCEVAARRAGLKPDTRGYHPHVTLAYLRRPDPGQVAGWIAANNLIGLAPIRVESFGLYSSWLGAGPSDYRLERLYRLARP